MQHIAQSFFCITRSQNTDIGDPAYPKAVKNESWNYAAYNAELFVITRSQNTDIGDLAYPKAVKK
jgi:hypothetical protein